MSNEVTFLKNGPIQVTGPTKLVDQETGKEVVAAKWPVYLCRCGHSDNKPFCDGMHKKQGFVGACSKASMGPP
jgi:CDGSH-type Zn-finger protein